MKWSTDKIMADLAKITGLKVGKDKDTQGGYYCRDIFIKVPGGDGINIIGFNLDDISDVDNPTQDIEYVEVRNFKSDSDGGLEKSAKPAVRKVYFEVVDYFNKKNVQIVDQLKDMF